jgi:hypothetical protein
MSPANFAVVLSIVISNASGLWTLKLQRQEVPILKNGAVVAHKTAFFGKITVGRPAQEFTVVFDTGSGHLILPSSSCDSQICKDKHRYRSDMSSTCRNISSLGDAVVPGQAREQLAITFGTGKVVGEFVNDNVCLHVPQASPEEAGQPKCVDIRIVAATSMSEDPFHSFMFDGVLGLSLDKLSLNSEFNFFGQLAKQSGVGFQSQFALFLNGLPSLSSQISFGGHDESKLATPLQWAPVADPEHGYWQLAIKSVKIGAETLTLCEKGACRAIIDSGTSLLGVPRSELRTMHRALARVLPQDQGAVDCRKWDGPPITFDFGELIITITAEEYSRMSPASMLVAGGRPDQRRDFCRASLLPVDLKEPLGPAAFVLGEPVLRRFYTVFDWSRKQVGMGLARQSAEADSGGRMPRNGKSKPLVV